MVTVRGTGLRGGTWRRGNAIAITAASMSVLLGFSALAVDVGMLYNVRTELQRTADAAALAAAYGLLDEHRLKGSPNYSAELSAARAAAQSIAVLNPVRNAGPQVLADDVRIGYLNNSRGLSEPIDFNNPAQYNTAEVIVRRDNAANGPVQLLFARIFGRNTANVTATAAASLKDGVVGYKVTSKTGNAELMPLALHVNAWNNLLSRARTAGDGYAYNPDTGTVSSGSDGIFELNLYPGSGGTQLPPGNLGTVNIGTSNNSTSHLSSQIRYGVTAQDLAFHGGELKLGPNGTLILTGDPGLSAAIKDDLEAIKGKPRSIPLFRQVSGPGNNAQFTIVGFAGVRILDVRLTGKMDAKRVIVQPAFVVDDAVITEAGSGPSFFVYAPIRLVR